MSPIKRVFMHVLLPLFVVAIAVGGGVKVVQSRPEPMREPPRDERPLVQTVTAVESTERLDVLARGQVSPARQVILHPQVTGRIQSLNPDLEPGGFIESGAVLARLERSDYEFALADARAALNQARAQLALEEGQQAIARREWELFQQGNNGEQEALQSALALREPQLRIAESAVEAAENRVRRTEQDLRRTTVEAPFNAVVHTLHAQVGQLISPQSPVVTLVGADAIWVNVSVPLDRLPFIDIPGVNAEEGSMVTVTQDISGTTQSWQGQVVRLISELDPLGRMARVLVEVKDPFRTEEAASLPLLLGAYVQVEFQGNRHETVIELPRRALHDGNRVYVFSEEGRLSIREVDVLWRRPETILIAHGVAAGERVIVSPIATPVEGLAIRTNQGEKQRENRGENR